MGWLSDEEEDEGLANYCAPDWNITALEYICCMTSPTQFNVAGVQRTWPGRSIPRGDEGGQGRGGTRPKL